VSTMANSLLSQVFGLRTATVLQLQGFVFRMQIPASPVLGTALVVGPLLELRHCEAIVEDESNRC